MDRLANPVAELRLRLLFQDGRSWLVADLDGAPLPATSLDYADGLPDDLRFALQTLGAWCREASRPESDRVALEDGIGRTLAGILFTDDDLLRALATQFPERSGFSPERSFQPDSRNRLRRDLETWLETRRCEALRVLIVDDEHPQLAGLPWEMLTWDRDTGPVRLGLDRQFTLSRLRPLPAAITARSASPRPLRVFYVAARDQDLTPGDARLTHYIRHLQECKHETLLRRLTAALNELPDGSQHHFRKLLDTGHLGTAAAAGEPCTLLHIEAHGIRPKDYWQGILTHEESDDPEAAELDGANSVADLVPRTVTAGDLVEGLGDAGIPAVAFLGTCYGGQGEPAEWQRESRRSLGERLLEIGIGAVVGTNGGILTTELPALAGDFYDEIARGATVDRATQTLRRRLYRRHRQVTAGALPPERWWRPMVLARGPSSLDPFDVEETPQGRAPDSPAEATLRWAIEAAGAEGPKITLEDDTGTRHASAVPRQQWEQLHELVHVLDEERGDAVPEAALAAGQALLTGRPGRILERRLRDLAAIGRRTLLRIDVPPALRTLPWEAAWWPDAVEAVLKSPSDERTSAVPGLGIAVRDWPRTLAAANRIEIGPAARSNAPRSIDPRSRDLQTMIPGASPAAVPATYPETARRFDAFREPAKPWLGGLAPAIWWDVFDGFAAASSTLEEALEADTTDPPRTLIGGFEELPPEALPSADVGHDLRDHLASLAPPLPDATVADLIAWSESADPRNRDLLDGLRASLAALDDGEREQLVRVSVLRGFQPRKAWREVLGHDPAPLLERLSGGGLAFPRSDAVATLTGESAERWLIPRLTATLCRLEARSEAVRDAHRRAAQRYVPACYLEVADLAKSAEEVRFLDAAPGGRLGLSAHDWFEARYHWLRAEPDGLEIHWCDRHLERWLVPRQVPFLMEHSHRCVELGTDRRRET